MHYWGDEWFQKNGDDFYEAIRILEERMKKWGHVHVCGKEKYGTYRDEYLMFWDGGLYSSKIVRIPKWVHIINFRLIRGKKTKYGYLWYGLCDFTRWIGLKKLVNKWQANGVNKAFQITLKEYPQFLYELVSNVDCYMCIKPCKWGDVDGEKIHNECWKPLI